MSVDTKHPDLVDHWDEYQMARDFERGQTAVRRAGERYLPMPSGFKISASAGRDEYAAYADRARFPDIFAPTVAGMVGIVHRTEFKIEGLDEGPLAELWERATVDGLTLEAFSRRITAELLRTGRYAVLADMPPEGGEVPYLAGYTAECVVNWTQERDFFVLDESGRRRTTDGFTWENYRRFRVLRLLGEVDEETGAEAEPEPGAERTYAAAVYEDVVLPGADGAARTERGEEVRPMTEAADLRAVPRATGGVEFGEIPLVVAGARDLGLGVEAPPLLGVLNAARAIWQLDADYRLQLFMTGQETLVLTGIDKNDVPATVGATVVLALPTGASAQYVGPAGTGIDKHKQAIDDAKQDAVRAGAQLFDQTEVPDESGKSRKLRYAAQTATLTTIAQSSAAALERALRYAALFVGADPGAIIVTPNLEFVDSEMTPQEAQALMAVWQGGMISYDTAYEVLQRGRLASAERTAQEEQDLIDQETPDAALEGGDLGGGDLGGGLPPEPLVPGGEVDEELDAFDPAVAEGGDDPGAARFVETGDGLEIEEDEEDVSDEELAMLFSPELLAEVGVVV